MNIDDIPLWNARKGLSEQQLDMNHSDFCTKIHSVLFTDEFLKGLYNEHSNTHETKFPPKIYSNTEIEAINSFLETFMDQEEERTE